MFKKKDLLLIIPFLILGVCLLFWTQKSHDAGIAVIEENGSEIARYDLAAQTQTEVIDIGGDYHVKLLLEPGKFPAQAKWLSVFRQRSSFGSLERIVKWMVRPDERFK